MKYISFVFRDYLYCETKVDSRYFRLCCHFLHPGCRDYSFFTALLILAPNPEGPSFLFDSIQFMLETEYVRLKESFALVLGIELESLDCLTIAHVSRLSAPR